MPGDIDDDLPDGKPAGSTPWHNSTRALVAASVAGLAAIAVLVAGVMFMVRESSEPEQAPLNYVDPSFSHTSSEPAPPTTTETITSTVPPVTSDINPPTDVTSGSETSGSETSGSETPGSETPGSETPAETANPQRTRQSDSGDDDGNVSTTRRRPRLNETRTLYPVPSN